MKALYFDLSSINNGSEILQALQKNIAVYNRVCYEKYNYNENLKKWEKQKK